jgi:hypothetical protein
MYMTDTVSHVSPHFTQGVQTVRKFLVCFIHYFFLAYFNDALNSSNIQRRMVEWWVKDELDSMCKEEVVAYVDVPCALEGLGKPWKIPVRRGGHRAGTWTLRNVDYPFDTTFGFWARSWNFENVLWASSCLSVRSALFWGVTQRRVVILYRRFGTTCRSHLQGSRSLCLSVRPHGTTQLPLDGFSLNLLFDDFSKICRENLSFIKIWQ